jgi:hypothetical protein
LLADPLSCAGDEFPHGKSPSVAVRTAENITTKFLKV